MPSRPNYGRRRRERRASPPQATTPAAAQQAVAAPVARPAPKKAGREQVLSTAEISYPYISGELKVIGILTFVVVAVLIILALVL